MRNTEVSAGKHLNETSIDRFGEHKRTEKDNRVVPQDEGESTGFKHLLYVVAR